MNDAEKLTMLKADLQLLTDSNDSYLQALLEYAGRAIEREGIRMEEGDIQCDMAQVHYAAYLFRKRAAAEGNTGMPRFLRYELNNILFSQKGRA